MAALHLARRWSLLFTRWEIRIFGFLLLAQPNQTQSTHCRVTDTPGQIQLEGCWVMVLSVIILTVGWILWGTLTLFPVHLSWYQLLLHSCAAQWRHDLLDVIASVSMWRVWMITSHTRGFGHSALPFLCPCNTGLWRYKGQRGIWALDLQKGHTGPRLRSFPKSTCFVLLHTGTPLAPLAKFAFWRALTWVTKCDGPQVSCLLANCPKF